MNSKAFIFAAGEGRRMLPLTEHCPKPLLKVRGKCLIEHHIEKLVAAGFCEIVINVSYLAEQVIEHLGNGERYGADIQFSLEERPLETGGGLLKALPLLGEEPFVLVNGDVWTDFPFSALSERKDIFTGVSAGDTRLFLVENPDHNPSGDFAFKRKGDALSDELVLRDSVVAHGKSYTFSGISILNPALIAQYPSKREKFPLLEVFQYAIEQQQLKGEIYSGRWVDVGTPQRLDLVNLDLPD
ncbi:UTP--glucose-1-phosphate uridylyltransferase [Thalassocella blandensis]|nr:UTP--glucose-1-phosphate uridylyltransferase [Thalassocella blandensis]